MNTPAVETDEEDGKYVQGHWGRTVLYPIDPGFKVKWLAWLRDPANCQASSTLMDFINSKYCYCCLGGACVVAGQPASLGRFEKLQTAWTLMEDGSDLNLSSFIPGLTEPVADLLASMNDGGVAQGTQYDKHSFTEIADFIEAHL